jgi:O-succinylhomoserine sulfhydrylase
MKKKFETIAVRTRTKRTPEREHSSPLYLTSSFTFDNAEQMRAVFADELEGNIYSRFSNPNVKEFEEKMALLEGTEAAYATATGMAAVFASFMTFLKTGDHILSARAIFGSTHAMLTKYLPKWGIEHSYFDGDKPREIEKLIRKNTKMLFIESPSNPGLEVFDLEVLGKLAKKHNLIYNVDNCFATPYLQQPVKYGADLITHSATKFIDGQGRVLGGVVCGKKELIKEIYLFCRNTGPALSPFNAWILSKSLETLAVRMDRHCENAMTLAKYFSSNKEIEKVNYPFLSSHDQYKTAKKQMQAGGGVVTFVVKGGYERAKKFMNCLELLSLSANLGDTRSIATHPASSTHAKLSEEERKAVGITPGLIRISVGLENMHDIIEDVENALKNSKK